MPPLKRPAATGVYNPAELRPFDVWNLRPPQRWDPSAEKLALSYEINDPNHLIQSGRIRYSVRDPATTGWTVVARLRLPAGLLAPGKHELADAQRWDGVIGEGLTDRAGEKITADLSRVRIEVQVWNNANAEPGTPVAGTGGRTNVAGEWLSFRRDHVEVDAIVEAKWDRTWVIPYEPESFPPLEPGKGEAEMLIKVKNVREGTPVRIQVRRIGDPADASRDTQYVESSSTKEKSQPGLQKLVVKGQKVVQSSGAAPKVRFDQYLTHWAEDGNNFYMFAVAFGPRGEFIDASPRDHANNEKACLHLRFTVAIFALNSGLQSTLQAARSLHSFLRGQTRYYRSYLITHLNNIDEFVKYAAARYIVIVTGHASTWCEHPDHPRVSIVSRQFTTAARNHGPLCDGGSARVIIEDLKGAKQEHLISLPPAQNHMAGLARAVRGLGADLSVAVHQSRKTGRYYLAVKPKSDPSLSVKVVGGIMTLASTWPDFKELYYEGFPPDEDCCPTELLHGKKGGRGGAAGCGNRSHVAEALWFGKMTYRAAERGIVKFGNKIPTNENRVYPQVYLDGQLKGRVDVKSCTFFMPRFAFLADGCRTILTTGLGQLVLDNGSRYYHGWTYTSSDSANLIGPLFRRWIKGTPSDPAPVEYEFEDRFPQAYLKLTQKGGLRSSEPRLMNKSGVLLAAAADRAAEALA